MIDRIESGELNKSFSYLYLERAAEQKKRYCDAVKEFGKIFGEDRDVRIFSAPGRTEIGGNHTDHQHGMVLAGSVNLDVIAIASPNSNRKICIQSKGYKIDVIDLNDLAPQEEECSHAASLIRGVAARFHELGMEIGGFDAYTTSSVMKGSGLSSSAAFETIVGVMLNCFYADEKADALQIAQIGQYAENVYFGKPCGLMDQTACSVGGFVTIDFIDPKSPIVERVDVDFEKFGYKLCIVDTGGNHADLTDDYASAPSEMCAVAQAMGKYYLREVEADAFYRNVSKVREKCTDRAILRAFHFFADNDRVPMQATALKNGDFEEFKRLIIESGHSSFMYLQNVFTCKNPDEQGLSLGLAISEQLLNGRGAWRVHGGGFAGTIQCFVPQDLLTEYKTAIERVFGEETCHVLSIRPIGGTEVKA